MDSFESMSLLELSEYYSRRNRAIFGDVRERMRAEENIELEKARERIRRAIRGARLQLQSSRPDDTQVAQPSQSNYQQLNRNQSYCPALFGDTRPVSSPSSGYGTYQQQQEDEEGTQGGVGESITGKRKKFKESNSQVKTGGESTNFRGRRYGTSELSILKKPPVLLPRRQKMSPRNVPIVNDSRETNSIKTFQDLEEESRDTEIYRSTLSPTRKRL